MLLKALREGLGRIIIFIDYVTRPTKILRTDDEQHAVNANAQSMSLYQFYACPFCVKTRRAIHRLNIPIEVRDAQHNTDHRNTLLAQGGAIKVPCLRVEQQDQTQWLYESNDIIQFLEAQFGQKCPS